MGCSQRVMRRSFVKKSPYIPCPVGRASYDVAHRTCKSCPIECREKNGKKKANVREPISTLVIGARLITTCRLNGLNTWNNKPRWLYVQERNRWHKVLAGAFSIWGPPAGKRTLLVQRLVRDRRHLIKDRDNLVGGMKVVKDVLVRQRVLIDDSDEFLEFEITQSVDKDNPRVEIILL